MKIGDRIYHFERNKITGYYIIDKINGTNISCGKLKFCYDKNNNIERIGKKTFCDIFKNRSYKYQTPELRDEFLLVAIPNTLKNFPFKKLNIETLKKVAYNVGLNID